MKTLVEITQPQTDLLKIIQLLSARLRWAHEGLCWDPACPPSLSLCGLCEPEPWLVAGCMGVQKCAPLGGNSSPLLVQLMSNAAA